MGLKEILNQRNYRSILRSLLFCCLLGISTAHPAEFFVSPGGSPAAAGSLADPWDLQTALNHPPALKAGDLIWMRGGVYRKNNELTKFQSQLNGLPDQPIIVRQYPGERAIIDGNVSHYNGGWVHYWGFEIMNTHSNRITVESGSFPTAFNLFTGGQTNDWTVAGFDLRAPNVKLINLVIHDSIGGGVSVSTTAKSPELYGTLAYYNGWQGCDRGHGHGIYIQSKDPSIARVSDNLFFANYALGIQATGDGDVVDNIVLEGNTVFANGILARKHQGNLLIGAVSGLARNPVLTRNLIYDADGSSSDSNIGYVGGTSNALLSNNYFQTRVHFSQIGPGLTLTSNTFVSGTSSLQRTNYPNNAFLSEIPAANVVEVRTNKYEAGRATIIVYNWENLDNIKVNVAGFLQTGSPFEVRSAQNFLGAAVTNGIFDGALLELPLNPIPVAKPIGTNAPASTAPLFQAFIIRITEQSPDPNFTNTAPAISGIPDVTTHEDIESIPVDFSIQDLETPPEYLNLSVLSSNPKLIPHRNIRFEGTGAQRRLTLMPAPREIGSAVVTIAISDGLTHTETSFSVNVLPRSDPPGEISQTIATLTLRVVGQAVLIHLTGEPNIDYDVQTSTNLVSWSFIGTVSTDCLGLGTHEDFPAQKTPPRYYRVLKANH